MSKPILKKVPESPDFSFVYKDERFQYFASPWHYHPEYEFIYVAESSGVRIIGDNVCRFNAGDLVLIGEELPHIYINDKSHYNSEQQNVRGIAVQFKKDFLGDGFFNVPEMSSVHRLLAKADRGISITGKTQAELIGIMLAMGPKTGQERLVLLLQMLTILAVSDETTELCGPDFMNTLNSKDTEKMNLVLQYISDHFRSEISLEKAAESISMSTPSFCRYFRKRTGKTFTQYITDIRIGYACGLLREDAFSVTQVCFESGFDTVSYFNRQFKKIKQMTPLKYRKQYRDV